MTDLLVRRESSQRSSIRGGGSPPASNRIVLSTVARRPSAFGSPATSMSSIWPFDCGAKNMLGTGTSGGTVDVELQPDVVHGVVQGGEGSAQRTAKSSTRLHTVSAIRRAGSARWVESGQAATPQDDLASTQKSARGALSPRSALEEERVVGQGCGSTLATEFMSEKADGEINAGGT